MRNSQRGLLSINVFVFDVTASIHVDGGLVDGGQRALYFAGGTHHQAARRDDGAFRKQGAGGYDAAFADDYAVEDGGAHADEAAGLDGAAVQRDGVAYRDVVAEDERVFVLHDVEDGAVLNVGAGADADVVDVAADDAERPHAGVFADDHVADDDRGGIDVGRGGDLRALAAIGANVGLAGGAHK